MWHYTVARVIGSAKIIHSQNRVRGGLLCERIKLLRVLEELHRSLSNELRQIPQTEILRVKQYFWSFIALGN